MEGIWVNSDQAETPLKEKHQEKKKIPEVQTQCDLPFRGDPLDKTDTTPIKHEQ